MARLLVHVVDVNHCTSTVSMSIVVQVEFVLNKIMTYLYVNMPLHLYFRLVLLLPIYLQKFQPSLVYLENGKLSLLTTLDFWTPVTGFWRSLRLHSCAAQWL